MSIEIDTQALKLAKFWSGKDRRDLWNAEVDANVLARELIRVDEAMRTGTPVATSGWRNAVTEACVVACIGWDESDPRTSLANLLAWEVQVALDPLVSGAARKLVARGREQAAKICEKRADERTWEKCAQDPETGAPEFSNEVTLLNEEDQNCADAIRAAASEQESEK